MAPTLYLFHGSPPARAVLITAKAVGVSLDIRVMNVAAGELVSPEFLKLNPQHTVPVLNDNGNVICESHAINAYLISKYGKDDLLHPKDSYKRALVDQRIHLDTGVLFPIIHYVVGGFLRRETKEISQKHHEELKQALDILEKLLEGNEWIAVDNVTIADFSCVTTITALHDVFHFNMKDYPNINNWVKRCQALAWFADDGAEIEAYRGLLKIIMP